MRASVWGVVVLGDDNVFAFLELVEIEGFSYLGCCCLWLGSIMYILLIIRLYL